MKLDLDHELAKLGAVWLAEVEPLTTAVVLERAGRSGASPRAGTMRPRRRRSAATVAKAAAAVAVVTAFGAMLRAVRDDPATAPESLSSASNSIPTTMVPTTLTGSPVDLAWPPRLLIDEFWSIDSINEIAHADIELGEVSYRTNGGGIWLSYSRNESAIPDSLPEVDRVDVLGVPTVVHGSGGSGPVSVDTPLEELDAFMAAVNLDGTQLMFSSTDLTAAEFGTALADVHIVGEAEFLDALPPAAVATDERDRWVDALLVDTPVPEDFDRAAFGNPDAIMMLDGFRGLGGRMAIEVTCAWTDQWFDAQDSGDSDESTATADALSTIREWGVFANIEAYVINDFARVTDALVAGDDYADRPIDRELVDSSLNCSTGQIGWG